MRYEETVVVSPGGWTTRVTIHEFGPSPGGTTERILRSQSYNFKNGADNETEEQRKSREAVKRNARRRATDRFDEEKTEAKKSQRRKRCGAHSGAAGNHRWLSSGGCASFTVC